MSTVTTKRTVFGVRNIEVPRYRYAVDRDGKFCVYDMVFPHTPAKMVVYESAKAALDLAISMNKAEILNKGKNPEFNIVCDSCGEESAFDETSCPGCGATSAVAEASLRVRMKDPGENQVVRPMPDGGEHEGRPFDGEA